MDYVFRKYIYIIIAVFVSFGVVGIGFSCGLGAVPAWANLLDCGVPAIHPGSCLATGTIITLNNGQTEYVENIKPSQEVLGFADEKTLIASKEPIVDLLPLLSVTSVPEPTVHTNETIFELTDSLGNVLIASAGHPIITNNRGVIPMAFLQKGDILYTLEGFSTVVNLVTSNYQGAIHNFILGNPEESIQVLDEDMFLHSFYANNILVGDLFMQQALER